MWPNKTAIATASIRVELAVENTFSFLINPQNAQLWIDTTQYISHTPSGQIRIGTLVECYVEILGHRTKARYRFTELSAPTRISGEGWSTGFRYKDTYDLSEVSEGDQDGSTELRWQMTIEYPVFVPLGTSTVRDLMFKDMERRLSILKRILNQKSKK